ncbi:MAG: oligopeptide ABC transporter permease OppB [Campylobacterales bacterium]|nr:oligopeptide ABC transporter permease OppB [Campylobacterales bacterium]NQY52201.1 oligopeptide ABC transporter permease OppB [Campylobacteraceae bacterium]
MLKFIIKRIFVAIPTLLVLISISFILVHSAPGSPFTDDRDIAPEIMRSIEAKYHLDKPLYVQYVYYLKDVVTWDFGPSFKYKDFSINELVNSAFLVSLKIGFWAFAFAVFIGVACGVVAALNQNTKVDYIIMSCAMVGVAIPNFVLGPVLVLTFAIFFKVLPAGGWNGGGIEYIILPVIAMSFRYIASIARIMRASMIEVLNSNFIRTAKAKGMGKTYIIFHHALRPSILPVVSYMGPAFVGIITGSVVIETIFGLPGIGQLFVNGALNRDYNMVLTLTIIVGGLMILFNTIVDILYVVIDPKIKY